MMRSGFFHTTMISVSLVASTHQLELSRYTISPMDLADQDTGNFAEEGAFEQQLAMVDSTDLIHFLEKEKQQANVKKMAAQIIANQAGKKLRKKKRQEEDNLGANPGFDPENLSDADPDEADLGTELEMPQQASEPLEDQNVAQVDENELAKISPSSDIMQLASTEAETQVRLMEDAYEDVTLFLSQLDGNDKDELATTFIQAYTTAQDFYEGLQSDQKERATTLFAQAQESAFEWLESTSQDDRKKLFNMLVQTGYGQHALSGERSGLVNQMIDFFKQQDFTNPGANTLAQATY